MPSANIILTSRCVNQCPYCFAGRTLEQTDLPNLSAEEFTYFLDLLKASGRHDVRLLGGEPFLHPAIGSFIDIVLADAWFEHLTIFTSGFLSRQYHDMLTHPKINVVVNVNHPTDYPDGRFRLLCANLSAMADAAIALTTGFNIYRSPVEYAPIVDLATVLGVRTMRWSVAVGAVGMQTVHLERSQKRFIVPQLLDFLESCRLHDITPVMDCPLEPCSFTTEELGRFARLCPDAIPKLGTCSPVIDLAPGYRVFRCFAVGEKSSVDARLFKTLDEIDKSFQKELEALRPAAAATQCGECHYLSSRLCLGGCLADHWDDIARLQISGRSPKDTLTPLAVDHPLAAATSVIEQPPDNDEQPMPHELLLERGSMLLRQHRTAEFEALVSRNFQRLIASSDGGSSFLLANYYSLHHDYGRALGLLRRCLAKVDGAKVETIRGMIRATKQRLATRNEQL